MSLRLRIVFGSRIFAPSLLMTVLTLVAAVAFVSLGRWQWNKGELRAAQAEAFARGSDQAVPLGTSSLDRAHRFQRVILQGRFDGEHQFLLENRTHNGRPGYEVLTPLDRSGGDTVLVNRGWIPFSGYRDRLPDVSFETPPSVQVIGRVDELPTEGLASGRAPPTLQGPWPRVTTFPHADELSAALGRRIESRILLLDPAAPYGYVREWQPPGMTAMRHWGYAVQWWAFALLAVVLWVIMGLKKTAHAGHSG